MVAKRGRNGECKNGGGAGEDWRLVIAGPDEQGTLKALKTQVARLGLEESVVFAGPVYGAEKWRILRSADLFALPTRSENFGIVVAEALACGVPVITTKGAPWSELLGNSDHSSLVHYCDSALVADDQKVEGGGRGTAQWQSAVAVGSGQGTRMATNELARTGRAGWWVDIGVEPLAEALREAMGLTDEERRIMGENGRRLVERKYRWETVAREMCGVYEGLLRPPTGAR